MKHPRLIVVLAAMAAFMLTGCGEESPPPPVTQSNPSPVSGHDTPSTDSGQVERTEKPSVWPFFEEEEQSFDLAENLMAKNYFLIFDGSGSMAEFRCSGNRPKIDVARDAVVQWSGGVPADANLGLYVFHNDDRSTLPLSGGPRDAFIRTVRSIGAGGGTPLSDAMLYAYRELTMQAKRQLGYGEYTIVAVTDGIANDERRLEKIVENILEKTPINIYSIGFCIGTRHSLNQPGRTIYKQADNPEQLARGLEDVLAESETFDPTEFEKP
jgi:hypothetical protein